MDKTPQDFAIPVEWKALVPAGSAPEALPHSFQINASIKHMDVQLRCSVEQMAVVIINHIFSPSEDGQDRSQTERTSGSFLQHIVKLEQLDTSMSASMKSVC